MKLSKSMKIWNVIYPVAIYFVVTAVALFVLDFVFPADVNDRLLKQLITSCVSVPFLYSFYYPDQMMRGKVEGNLPFWKQCKMLCAGIRIKQVVWMFVIGGCFAVAWNNLLGMVKLAEHSASYQQVEQTFYTGRLPLEILALCIVIPFVEELLYRGIVYGRIKDSFGVKAAVIGSAVIFGAVHMNLVQFVYAAVFGLLLAWFVERSGNIAGAVAAHMAANLTSVLRAETNVFAGMDNHMVIWIVVTVLMLFITGIGVWKVNTINVK